MAYQSLRSGIGIAGLGRLAWNETGFATHSSLLSPEGRTGEPLPSILGFLSNIGTQYRIVSPVPRLWLVGHLVVQIHGDVIL